MAILGYVVSLKASLECIVKRAQPSARLGFLQDPSSDISRYGHFHEFKRGCPTECWNQKKKKKEIESNRTGAFCSSSNRTHAMHGPVSSTETNKQPCPATCRPRKATIDLGLLSRPWLPLVRFPDGRCGRCCSRAVTALVFFFFFWHPCFPWHDPFARSACVVHAGACPWPAARLLSLLIVINNKEDRHSIRRRRTCLVSSQPRPRSAHLGSPFVAHGQATNHSST